MVSVPVSVPSTATILKNYLFEIWSNKNLLGQPGRLVGTWPSDEHTLANGVLLLVSIFSCCSHRYARLRERSTRKMHSRLVNGDNSLWVTANKWADHFPNHAVHGARGTNCQFTFYTSFNERCERRFHCRSTQRDWSCVSSLFLGRGWHSCVSIISAPFGRKLRRITISTKSHRSVLRCR